MKWTLCYSLMTVTLGSVIAYGMIQAADDPSVIKLDDALSCSVEAAPMVRKHVEAPASPTAQPSTVEDDSIIKFGSSREHVLARLGVPDAINEDNTRWAYGRNVLVFKDDALAGNVIVSPAVAQSLAIAALDSKKDDAKDQTKRGRTGILSAPRQSYTSAAATTYNGLRGNSSPWRFSSRPATFHKPFRMIRPSHVWKSTWRSTHPHYGQRYGGWNTRYHGYGRPGGPSRYTR